MSGLRYHHPMGPPYTTWINNGTNRLGNEYTANRYSDGTRSYQYRNRDGGVYDKFPDGSAAYHAPDGTVRYYYPRYYSDEDRSDGRYYSSEDPEETDSEYDDYRVERGGDLGRGYYVPGDRGAVHAPDSESPSECCVPESESETETDDCSDRYIPEDCEYESGSMYDRDDHDSYGDSYDDWDDYDDDYGDYDDDDSSDYYY